MKQKKKPRRIKVTPPVDDPPAIPPTAAGDRPTSAWLVVTDAPFKAPVVWSNPVLVCGKIGAVVLKY
jgi:hypothetical protein